MRRAAVAIGWTLVATIVWLSLTPSPPSIDLGIAQADKIEHAGFYAATMFCFAQLYLRTRVRAAYAIGLVALGITIEFIQPHFGRDYEVADMAADALGVALGWAAALALPIRIFRP